MADTITLDALTQAVVYEAGIDGKTGHNARHDTDALYALINRQYKQLRSLVSQWGEEFVRSRTAAAALPSRLSAADLGEAVGDDFIAVDYPTDASEIISVDVYLSGEWQALTRSTWTQRRVFAGVNRPDSPGEWTTISMPSVTSSDAGGDIVEGRIGIWPPTLTGLYSIAYLPHWVPVLESSAQFIIYPHWEEWLICSCVMAISQRDNDKRRTYEIARERKGVAEAQVIQHARRSKRGAIVARRRDGLEL